MMNNFDATTFGVKGDGATDDTEAANAALAAAWAINLIDRGDYPLTTRKP